MARGSSKWKIGRTKKIPGTVLDNSSMPKGWVWHSPGYITPTLGTFKGTPFSPDSNTAKLLGWPGPCLTGQLNLTTPKTEPRRGFEQEPVSAVNNLHTEAMKTRPISDPAFKAVTESDFPPPSSER